MKRPTMRIGTNVKRTVAQPVAAHATRTTAPAPPSLREVIQRGEASPEQRTAQASANVPPAPPSLRAAIEKRRIR